MLVLQQQKWPAARNPPSGNSIQKLTQLPFSINTDSSHFPQKWPAYNYMKKTHT